jgi:hypothetical protein
VRTAQDAERLPDRFVEPAARIAPDDHLGQVVLVL